MAWPLHLRAAFAQMLPALESFPFSLTRELSSSTGSWCRLLLDKCATDDSWLGACSAPICVADFSVR